MKNIHNFWHMTTVWYILSKRYIIVLYFYPLLLLGQIARERWFMDYLLIYRFQCTWNLCLCWRRAKCNALRNPKLPAGLTSCHLHNTMSLMSFRTFNLSPFPQDHPYESVETYFLLTRCPLTMFSASHCTRHLLAGYVLSASLTVWKVSLPVPPLSCCCIVACAIAGTYFRLKLNLWKYCAQWTCIRDGFLGVCKTSRFLWSVHTSNRVPAPSSTPVSLCGCKLPWGIGTVLQPLLVVYLK